jgi:hypothetical protein
MKYETPQLTALDSAINAVQTPAHKAGRPPTDGINFDVAAAYEDWE